MREALHNDGMFHYKNVERLSPRGRRLAGYVKSTDDATQRRQKTTKQRMSALPKPHREHCQKFSQLLFYSTMTQWQTQSL